MLADLLERLLAASAVQAVERSRPGAAEGLEISAVPARHSSSGHSDGLALSSSQRSLLAAVYCCGTTSSNEPRLPRPAEVKNSMKHLLRV